MQVAYCQTSKEFWPRKKNKEKTNPKQCIVLPHTSSLTSHNQPINFIIPWTSQIPFYQAICLPQERNQNHWGRKSREPTQGSVGSTMYLSQVCPTNYYTKMEKFGICILISVNDFPFLLTVLLKKQGQGGRGAHLPGTPKWDWKSKQSEELK